MDFFDSATGLGPLRSTEDTASFIASNDFFDESQANLANRVDSEMQTLGISDTNQRKIKKYLDIIEAHNTGTYLHSLRVGIIASEISKVLGIEARPVFIAGLLHDFGKISVPKDTLNKTAGFTDEDYTEVKKHVEEGYKFLVNEFSYSAEILLRHHTFGENPYPRIVPRSKIFSKKAIAKIEELARFLSLVDFYDAISSRKNEKYWKQIASTEEKKNIILEQNADQKELVEKLYSLGLFI